MRYVTGARHVSQTGLSDNGKFFIMTLRLHPLNKAIFQTSWHSAGFLHIYTRITKLNNLFPNTHVSREAAVQFWQFYTHMKRFSHHRELLIQKLFDRNIFSRVSSLQFPRGGLARIYFFAARIAGRRGNPLISLDPVHEAFCAWDMDWRES